MTLRKKIIVKTAFFSVLFLMIFAAGFFSSCKNIFGNSVPAIEEEQIQNEEQNPSQNAETKSTQTSVTAPDTKKTEPQPIIISGKMTINGAVPEEVSSTRTFVMRSMR